MYPKASVEKKKKKQAKNTKVIKQQMHLLKGLYSHKKQALES